MYWNHDGLYSFGHPLGMKVAVFKISSLECHLITILHILLSIWLHNFHLNLSYSIDQDKVMVFVLKRQDKDLIVSILVVRNAMYGWTMKLSKISLTIICLKALQAGHIDSLVS